MSIESPLTRRTMLRTTTAATGGVCALALTSCSPAESATPSVGSSPMPIPTTGTPVRVGKVSDIPVGTTGRGKAKDENIVIFRASETEVLAYTDVCTHAGCQIAPAGQEFHCPCHGSIFKASDGTVVEGPAKKALPRYAAAIDGQWITVSV